MKKKISISIDNAILEAFKKEYLPRGGPLSPVIGAALLAIIKNPLPFWTAKLKHHNDEMLKCREYVEYYKKIERAKREEELEREIEMRVRA